MLPQKSNCVGINSALVIKSFSWISWGATSSITHYAHSIQLCIAGSPLLFTRQFYKLQLKDLLSRNEASSQLRMRVKLWRVAGCHEFLASLGKLCDLSSRFHCTLLSDFIFKVRTFNGDCFIVI